MPETESENLIDQFFHLLQQLLLPDWSDLIALLPWVLLVLVLLYVVHTWWQWRRASAINRPRVPPRLRAGAPPPGVHMPGPSRWPFVVPIGAALLLFAFALSPRDGDGNPTAPFNMPLLVVGLLVTTVAVIGWLRDAMGEWRATAHGQHGTLVAATAGAGTLHGGSGSALTLAPSARAVAAQEREFVAVEPPPGVHMPGPSPWPFFAPIAVTLMLFGVIFSSVLIIGGLILAVIAASGWLIDAGREYRSTEEVGHAVPHTRDPVKVWPKRLVPVFAGVTAVSLLIALAPIGLNYLNGLTPASAGPSAAAVPAVPEISASSITSFDTGTLGVPCCRGFELVFNNNQAGVPHNVELTDNAAQTTTFFDGEVITGVASITYNVPAIPEGDYYFLCRIHPNMNGTLQSRPESGGAPGGPAGDPGPGASNPQASNAAAP
jgi:hypothetical protein